MSTISISRLIPTRRAALALVALLLSSLAGAMAAEGQQKPSPLVSQAFPFYYTTPATNSVQEQVHRAVITFGAKGATCELFPGLAIPFEATVKTQRTGNGKRSRTVMTDFSANGETAYGKGTISFTASKDGAGAKGTVTVKAPGEKPVSIVFRGTKS